MKISAKRDKWVIGFTYIAGIFVVTPYLPRLIRFAPFEWSGAGVSHFVLGVDITIAILLISLAIFFLVNKRKKSAILHMV